MAGMVNLKNNICLSPGCAKEASFNIEGTTKRLYCGDHKMAGMVNLKNNTCLSPGCAK